METKLLSTSQAAGILGVDDSRVRQLILSGRLPSMQVGRAHLIKESDLALVADRKAGRPKKDDAATNGSTGTKTSTLTKPMKKVVRKVQK
jgi:excisionase family DNA binding protein